MRTWSIAPFRVRLNDVLSGWIKFGIVIGGLTAPLTFPQAPATVESLTAAGRDAMYRLEYGRAREIFAGIIAAHPESPVGYGMMSVATFNEMLYAASNPTLQVYGAPNPYSATTIYESIEAESRRFHEATDRLISVTEGILERYPDDIEARYFRGLAEENLAAEAVVITRSKTAAFSHGRRAKGIHEDLLELAPGFVDARVSVAAYEFAKATLPLWLRIGTLGLLGGDKDKALEMMEEVGREGRYRDLDAHVLLSVMHAEKGDPKRSIEILESMGRQFPESYLIDLNLAAIQELQAEDPRAALATYEALLRSLPQKAPGLGEAEVRFLIGRTWFRLGDYTRAQAAFAAAIESQAAEAETRPLSHFYLGLIHEESRRPSAAVASYREFLSLADSMESLENEIDRAARKVR